MAEGCLDVGGNVKQRWLYFAWKFCKLIIFMTFTCQTNKVVNGAHLELSTETLVKFPRLGLISLDLEKTPQIWLDSDNWKIWGGNLESLIMIWRSPRSAIKSIRQKAIGPSDRRQHIYGQVGYPWKDLNSEISFEHLNTNGLRLDRALIEVTESRKEAEIDSWTN